MLAAIFLVGKLVLLLAYLLTVSGGRMQLACTGDRWSFVRDGSRIPFVVGLNHFASLLRPCSEDDKGCIQADLFAKSYGSNRTKAALAALEQFRSWGFNGAGYNAPPEHMAQLPFFAACFTLTDGSNDGANPWRPRGHVLFPDPWDIPGTRSMLEDKIEAKCKAVAPYRRNLLGYLWTDFPAYDISKAQRLFGNDYVTSLRRLPSPAAPGRKQYADFLRRRYITVAALCAAYGNGNGNAPKGSSSANASNASSHHHSNHLNHSFACAAQSWATLDLRHLNNTRIPAMLADDYGFLPQIVDRLYARAYNATKLCDPDGLIWGDTLVREWAGPLAPLVAVAAKYVDGLSIQPSGGMTHAVGGADPGGGADAGLWNASDWAVLRALVKNATKNATAGAAASGGGHGHGQRGQRGQRDLPMIVADVGFAFPRAPYPGYEWHEYASQAAAGAAYASWVRGAKQAGNIVAMSKCEYIDRYTAQPVPGLKLGMVGFDGTAHEPFASAVAAANAELRKS